MNMENEATITWSDGQLVINFTKKNYKHYYRNVKLVYNMDNILTVKANKVNYLNTLDYYDFFGVHRKYNDAIFDLIPESNIGEERIPIFGFWQIFFCIKPKKFITVKTIKDNGIGWIEGLHTNESFEFKTNNYLIIK